MLRTTNVLYINPHILCLCVNLYAYFSGVVEIGNMYATKLFYSSTEHNIRLAATQGEYKNLYKE